MELSTDDVTITVPDGCIWEMGLKKCGGGDVFFCNNWPQFAKYYSIGYGWYLVFKYEGNSKFSVVIFDSTSAEISYPRNQVPPDADLASSRMSKSAAASERAHAAAVAFNPQNPYFVSILKPDRLYVPVEFASKYLKPKVPLKIQNSKGEKWEVSCILNYVGSVSMRMAGGLAEFARGNDLSCVFELIKKRHASGSAKSHCISRS